MKHKEPTVDLSPCFLSKIKRNNPRALDQGNKKISPFYTVGTNSDLQASLWLQQEPTNSHSRQRLNCSLTSASSVRSWMLCLANSCRSVCCLHLWLRHFKQLSSIPWKNPDFISLIKIRASLVIQIELLLNTCNPQFSEFCSLAEFHRAF